MGTDQLGEVRGLCEVPICLQHESRFHSAWAEQLQGDQAANTQGSVRRLAGERGGTVTSGAGGRCGDGSVGARV